MGGDLGPCSIDECPNEAERRTPHGNLCGSHRRRKQPSREGGVKLTEPLQERIPPKQRLREIALEYAEAEQDLEFAKAEGKLDAIAEAIADSKLVLARLNKAAETYGSELHRERIRVRTREVLAQKKLEGVRLGRPPKLDQRAAADAVNESGGVRQAAEKLGVGVSTIRRALNRKGTPISVHGQMHTLINASGPPEDGESDE